MVAQGRRRVVYEMQSQQQSYLFLASKEDKIFSMIGFVLTDSTL